MLVTEYMRDEVDKTSGVQSCFIDLQKAFDTLDHDIILTNCMNMVLEVKSISF